MPETGVIQEQGYVTEDRGLGFTPLKEGEFDPFNSQRDVGKVKSDKDE